jgi:hypothetical protein
MVMTNKMYFIHSRTLYQLHPICFAASALICLSVSPSCDFVSGHHLHVILILGVTFVQF